jgi:hypothetical protein
MPRPVWFNSVGSHRATMLAQPAGNLISRDERSDLLAGRVLNDLLAALMLRTGRSRCHSNPLEFQ